jgi:polyphosphate kinase
VTPDLHAPELFTNRELSWLDFNARVLATAVRSEVPLLERLKFLAIAANNLDEFYMVRVAHLERQTRGTSRTMDPAGDRSRPADVLAEVGARARAASEETARVLRDVLVPELASAGIVFVGPSELDEAQQAAVRAYYRAEVHPCLTPIAIDPTHPFPHLRNRSLAIALRVAPPVEGKKARLYAPRDETLLALVQVPGVLPRFAPIPSATAPHAFMTLEDIVAMHASELFPGYTILEARPFRVTRASDLDISEDEADNLLTTIQDGLRRRDRGDAVRLEVVEAASPELVQMMQGLLEIADDHVHRHAGFIVTGALMSVCNRLDLPQHKYPPHSPVHVESLRYEASIFRAIADHDILLHHPYESFQHVVDLMNEAADDPNVVAIKQTLYRTSGNSPFVRALARAAANGKQVTALVELKARFDEAANIQWARALEEGGVHVVYGLLGLKTHCKMLLVIRRESGQLKRYLHLGTGNYNSTTARLYTDLSLLTAREDVTEDAMRLFNVLTGYAELPTMRRLTVSPFNTRERMVELIRREAEHARAGRPARIIAKMNALVDPQLIRALYRASQAGVEIDLLIRGICCLRPGIEGVSENIRVQAIIDRFLEHARIFWFANDGEAEVFLSSADWMPRNLNRRIEVTAPVLDPALVRRIREDILEIELADRGSSYSLEPDGSYRRREASPEEPGPRAQAVFMAAADRRRSPAPRTVRREFTAKNLRLNPVLRAIESRRRRFGGE